MFFPGKKRYNFDTEEPDYSVFEKLHLQGPKSYISTDDYWVNSKDCYYIRKKYVENWCSTRLEATKFLRTCPNIYNFGGNTSRFFFRVENINIIL